MNDDHHLKNFNERIAFSCILPIAFPPAAVWFTEDSQAIIIAHIFQLFCCLFLFFISGYIFSLMKRVQLLESKTFMLFFSLTIIIISSLSLCISYFINPAWGMGSMLFGVLVLNKYPIPIDLKVKFPQWYSVLINRITVMLCICIMVMLAYWLNPYSEPLNLYKL